ncbi:MULTISPECIES: terminase small subunit [unclassified Nitratiruptor]|uniref:terminase small subunit n=1 Tax=unclassified Nitratiruptor TaxID=2624044 RepID=UPI0019155762|nr:MULTISPECIES: terminase small subunit [unclassified Nitratiruptor]BCD59618.1 phage terminase small subunit [Nitratiruptor sp. YY08-10]BCD63542.1 phage terminase small subunit [Nitratiruptor sp. YY08-14]BCD83094.1 phage terminase small subunit [Nitratiruptor phage NrS-2]BCD83160.1 phage terminase small subunit [Nitratiruptor phage NrS-3]
MAKKLTQKQEKFCLEYVKTGNASEAYRRAYNAKNMKDETIWSKASMLLERDKVRVRVEELRKKAEDEAIMSVQELMQFYTEVIRHDGVEMKDRLKAADQLSKLRGDYTQKIEHKGIVPVDVEIVIGKD